ncbi:MAG: hypothetical protein M3270_06190, partial [Thermoproteota archaeon]|nr:hypothetical protein [Thermoproteota archaeon]
MTIPPPPSAISEPLKKDEKPQQQVKLIQESNTAPKQEVVVTATEQNPLKVEIRDHIRLHEAGEQLIFITSHMVPE